MAPTWSDDIKPIFSQYDRVQMLFHFDLHSYEDVKRYISAILMSVQPSKDSSLAKAGWSQLPNVHVMPKYATWTKEVRERNVKLLLDWQQAGFPIGKALPVPAPPDPELDAFLGLSKALTGYDDLHEDPALGNWYLTRLRQRSQVDPTVDPAALQRLLDAWSKAASSGVPDVGQLVEPAGEAAIARVIIELWYTAAFLAQDGPAKGNPEDIPPAPPPFAKAQPVAGAQSPAFGTPEDNRYVRGLVWHTAQAHPQGYSTEDLYWQHRPEPNGQFSGSYLPIKPGKPGKGQQS